MVQQPQDVKNRPNQKAFGVMFHTAGRGVLKRAKEWGVSPLKAAERIYTRKGASFAHYILSQDGTLLQSADEIEMAWHAGLPAKQRQLYVSGKWKTQVAPKTLARWEKKWKGFKSPSHLYPTKSPNAAYIGVEFLPDENAEFSAAQYAMGAALALDIAERHGFTDEMLEGKFPTPRLVGHEDIEPLERWNKHGGWDPGALRETPKFHWPRIYRRLRARTC